MCMLAKANYSFVCVSLSLMAGALAAGAVQAAGEYYSCENKWAETPEASFWGSRCASRGSAHRAVSVFQIRAIKLKYVFGLVYNRLPWLILIKISVFVCVSLSLLSKDDNGVVLSLGAESQRLIVSARPFRLDIMEGPEVLLSLNSRGLLAFEHLQLRKDTWVSTPVINYFSGPKNKLDKCFLS